MTGNAPGDVAMAAATLARVFQGTIYPIGSADALMAILERSGETE